MEKRLKDESIKNKLFRSLAICFVICTGVVIGAFYLVFRNELDNMHSTEMGRIVHFYSENINEVIDEMETICEVISTNYDIQQIVWKKPDKEKKLYLQERCNMNGRLALLTQSYTKVPYEIAVVLDDKRTFNYSQHSMKKDASFQKESWYKKARSITQNQWMWQETSQVFNSLIGPYLVVQKPIKNLQTNKVCGVVYVELAQTFLLDLMEDARDQNYAVSVEGSGHVLFKFGDTGKAARYTHHESAKLVNNWTMNVYMKDDVEYQLLMPVVLYFMLLIFILIVIFVMINFYFGKFITRPITQLVEKMNHLQIDSLTKPISVNTSLYEVRNLCESYNRMLKRIQRLIDHVKQEQVETQKAQYAVLQAQINPHFLYNTLDTIVWQIRTGEADAALKNLVDFSRYFRLSLGKGKQFVTIGDELEHTRIYLQLMSVRYMGQIRFSIESLDEEFLNYCCPKLILQPIVENSVNHGILEKESQSGIIKITVQKKERDIIIEIMDDGMGIRYQEVEKMNYFLRHYRQKETQQRTHGYGIFNINKRVQLLYGEEYGICIKSQYGEYTHVSVTLPAIAGGKEHGETDDCR